MLSVSTLCNVCLKAEICPLITFTYYNVHYIIDNLYVNEMISERYGQWLWKFKGNKFKDGSVLEKQTQQKKPEQEVFFFLWDQGE